jgi:hypothetical protein
MRSFSDLTTEPVEGAISPARILSSVDFPAPFAPMMRSSFPA